MKSVPVEIRCTGTLYEHHEPFVIGTIQILPQMSWHELDQRLRQLTEAHFRQLDIGLKTKKTSRLDPETSPDVTQQFSLGFSLDCIHNFNIGKFSSRFQCVLNSSLASGDFYRLLITFANSLDPDQDRQNVGPDLDPNCLTLR